ncbi:lamin tail domain-containing protein [Streptomyces sp. NPDC057445]|uniref:lamin tail domain-containing protein n=1 Tax=Streptomyces sp. NPDC057445 TaxID=3346136 RepID=UPI0036855671
MPASRIATRIAATVLASGAVVAAVAMPASADGRDRHDRHDGRHSSIVIGKVQADGGRGRDDHSNRSLNAEWVEVKNVGWREVNLRGFTLTDRDGNRYRFSHLRLDGHSSVKVHTGRGRDTDSDVYQDRRREIWNERDTATLRDDRGRTIDSKSWGRGGHHHR